MCRNIRPLNNFEPPATDDEVTAAALQFVRKVSGTTKPSPANQAIFDQAVARDRARHPAPARRPGHHGAAQGPRGRGRQGARPGRAAVRRVTLAAEPARPRARPRERRARSCADRPLVVLTGAGLSTDSGHPRLPRPGLPPPAADDLPGVRVRPGGAAALLGAQPPRLAPDGRRRAERRATTRWPRIDPEPADHPERRRPARAGRVAAAAWRCTAGSPTWSAWPAGRSRRGARCRSG